MKNTILILLAVSLLLLQAIPALAQGPEMVDDLANWKRSGQTAMPFLQLGAGARMMAMGDAGLAITGDASALFYNPAGLAYVENRSVMLGNMNWLLDTKIQSAALAMNFGQLGVFGLSAMFYNYGDPIKATEIDAGAVNGYRDIGEFTPSQFVVGVGYARQISAQFAIGGQLKYAYENLLGGDVKTRIAYQLPDGTWKQDEHDAIRSTFVLDFGTVYNTGFRDLTLAMSFRNFGGEIKYERDAYDIPLTFRFGVTGDVFKLLNKPSEDMELLLNVDYLHPRDWSERMNIGLEYGLKKMFYIRGGYKVNYSSEGLCVGGGLNLNLPMGGVRIDYAYKDTKDTLFDAVHVYSLCIDF